MFACERSKNATRLPNISHEAGCTKDIFVTCINLVKMNVRGYKQKPSYSECLHGLDERDTVYCL